MVFQARGENMSDPAEKPTRRWRSTEATRQAVLNAAIEVFDRDGYSEARIGEIVERSSASVGSIYHHFGGKAEIFEVLWERYNDAMWQAVRDAVSSAREAGETDPMENALVGARAYLSSLTDPEHAKLARIMATGDAPPELSERMQKEQRKWVQGNVHALGFGRGVDAQLRASVVVAMLGEAEMTYARDPREGLLEELTASIDDMLRRLLTR